MLRVFDPWLAGVVFPTVIILGLMAIPFIDDNPKGRRLFSFKERKWPCLFFYFLAGFVDFFNYRGDIFARAELEFLAV